MAAGGWLGITMPEQYGGSGLGVTEATVMMNEVASNGGGFAAHVWDAADLAPHWRLFTNWLAGWRIEQECAAAMQEAALTMEEAS